MLEIVPITFQEACEFVRLHHRHHGMPRSWKFGCGVSDGEKIVGVVIVGRPVNRYRDDGITLEVIRCCTDGTEHAPSKLYAAAWRATRALGYKRLGTYILESEPGTSLIAAGWKELYTTRGGNWNCKKRPREDKAPIEQKRLFEVSED